MSRTYFSNKFISKLLVFPICSTLLFPGTLAFGAGFDPDRLERPLGQLSLQISEPGTVINYSQLKSYNNDLPGEEKFAEISCESLQDTNCDVGNPRLQVWGRMILPICEKATQDNCVESLIFSKEGANVTAVFQRQAEGGTKFKADPAKNFFAAGSPLIFKVPGFEHSGGTDQYSLSVMAGVSYSQDKKEFETNDLVVSVQPTSVQFDQLFKTDSMGSGANNACAYVEPGVCGVKEDFPPGTSLQVSIRLPNTVGGWFMGRLQDPEVKISRFSQRNNLLTLKAKPVSVSRFAIPRDEQSVTAFEKTLLGSAWGSYGGNSRGVLADDPKAFEALNYFRAEAKDTAAGTSSLWSFRTIRAGQGSKCLSDTSKLQGIVTTNSMVYSGLSPSFESGYLNYQVAGLHYTEDAKSLSIGTYDLVMNSETARCLYGFSKAPISATVQVVGTGDENIATTVVSEKDGWLKLAAYGFTFSEKEIKVRLTQPYAKTLTKFSGTSKNLTSKQKSEIKVAVTKAKGNPKFICTGTYLKASSRAAALARAKATCAYGRALDKNHFYEAKVKQTKSTRDDSLVTISSK